MGFTTNKSTGNAICLKEGSWLEKGMPFLAWTDADDKNVDRDPAHIGWNLFICGAENTSIGFAAWNDVDGIKKLVNSMNDTESLLMILSLTDADVSSRLGAMLLAQGLKNSRNLPKLDLVEPKRLIVAAKGTSGPYQLKTRQTKGLARILYVKSGTSAITVAVALKAPDILANKPSLGDRKARGVVSTATHADYMKLLVAEGTAPWFEKITSTFVEAGWYPVDLPQPKLNYHSKARVVYFTKIVPEIWTGIRAADAAKTLEMNRGDGF